MKALNQLIAMQNVGISTLDFVINLVKTEFLIYITSIVYNKLRQIDFDPEIV